MAPKINQCVCKQIQETTLIVKGLCTNWVAKAKCSLAEKVFFPPVFLMGFPNICNIAFPNR